ncbi:uncharacterized protein LACBIDRAFT_331507 [Laccaria bicolor S238N-H82]|uniref:Predicted protein n=1 Tax=Laccaria bicolor (strain S238N-H82 / ATCC MYA-4686) TaxID=486041 RepID=B0DPP0_LACBS|nr:uncharacterized protein LACBIDRAFT_331507 [Laccaria bicolor S238N-H82]EDR03409.1 predicted protein [Laccaria bicolor S238N-H82]|eukprot:XP_001885865.1 predicted protein [Laccaria bicolor S238N-H82]
MAVPELTQQMFDADNVRQSQSQDKTMKEDQEIRRILFATSSSRMAASFWARFTVNKMFLNTPNAIQHTTRPAIPQASTRCIAVSTRGSLADIGWCFRKGHFTWKGLLQIEGVERAIREHLEYTCERYAENVLIENTLQLAKMGHFTWKGRQLAGIIQQSFYSIHG